MHLVLLLLLMLCPPVQVPDPEQQHRIMIEAVENHMPQVRGGCC
jgi:stage III sporulation protein SpoIIIAA